MLALLETLKDSVESVADSAVVRLENSHRLIGGYLASRSRRGIRSQRAMARRDSGPAASVYDVLRGLNREVGEFGTDVFQIIDDARARRRAEKSR